MMTRDGRIWEQIVEVDRDIVELCARLEERLPDPQARDRLFELLDLCMERKRALKAGEPLP
jgi:hypothetical protein